MMPPLPKKFDDAPDGGDAESDSELPPSNSPTIEAPEPSEGMSRKRSWSESSDGVLSPMPRGPAFLERHAGDEGAASPIATMPIRAIAPQPPAKKKKKKEKKKDVTVFALSDIPS